jgi:hypothetical protein
MGLHAKLVASFSNSPWAWVFFAAFVFAEYGNWQRGHDLTRVCALIPHDIVTYGHPVTPQQIVDHICASRNSDPDDGQAF